MAHQVSPTARRAVGIQATLDEWRARAMYVLLVVVAVASLPAYVSPVVNANQITPLLWVYLIVYLAFVGPAALPRIDVRLRGWAFILLAYANASASFARMGLAGSGRLYLVAIPVLATILIGSWAGYATAALSLVIYAVFTALAQAGVLSAWMTVQANPVTLGFWFEAGAALFVFLVIPLILVERFYSLHEQTLAASHQASVELERLTQSLQERLAFEQVITSISTEFINLGPDEIDTGIMHALQVIGEFTGDDRSYVFRFSEDGTRMDNTHEWCRAAIEPQIQNLQAQPVEILGWSAAKIKRLEVVHIPCVAELPSAASVDREQMQGQDIRSLILVPMVYRGQAVGFVGFDSVRRERTWTEDDFALLRIVGEIFANALEHKRAQQALQSAYQTLERRVEERTRELATLNAIAAVVSRSLDLTDILSDALDKTLEITQMGCGGSYRLEGEGDEAYLNPLVYRGLSDEFVRWARRLPLPGSGVQVAARTGQPLVWEVTSSPAELYMKQALMREGVELIVSVPLMAKGRLVGAIQLGAREVRSFAPEELSLLAAIGQQVGMAVENARLYEQAQQSATYAERSRLARELHDSVTQSLYSLTLYAEAAARMMQDGEHAKAADALREMRDTSQEALREMRLLIFQLRPPTLEKSGLAAALQARLDAVETRGGIRAKLLVEGASGAERLTLPVQEELYHIAQEALNNALKHAHPRQVRVCLRFDQDAVRLEIADDGAGFALQGVEESGGLGLSGMRERAERIGADWHIESAPGKGTKVTVRTHVSHVLGKLHLASRTQAALFALKEGLATLDDVSLNKG